jgi:hypothetical protein
LIFQDYSSTSKNTLAASPATNRAIFSHPGANYINKMRIQTLAATLAIGCASALLLDAATARSAVAQPVDPIQRLEDVGVPVVLPSYVPTGFELTQFEMDVSRFQTYNATYSSPDGCQISISGADGGWGGPSFVPVEDVSTPLFGDIPLEQLDNPRGTSADLNSLFSSAGTATGDQWGVLPGFPNAGYLFKFSCQDSAFSIEQASQILESMQIVE